MKKLLCITILSLCALIASARAELYKVSFDNFKEGSPVEGLQSVSGQWEIRKALNPNKTANLFLSLVDDASLHATKTAPLFSIALLQKFPQFSAGIFYARLRLLGNSKNLNAGLVIRYQDPSDFMYVGFSHAEKKVALYHVRGRQVEKLIESQAGIEPGKWLGLRIFLRQARIKVEIDGQVALQFSDLSLKRAGGLGFCAFQQTRADFDNIIVAPLPDQK